MKKLLTKIKNLFRVNRVYIGDVDRIPMGRRYWSTITDGLLQND